MDKPFLDKLRKIDPYVPGEQPKTDNIIKLNANENPYPPAPSVTEVLRTFDAAKLAIYPDANAKALKTAIAERFDLQPSQVFLGNGSDDVLALAFQSFFCSDKPILYPGHHLLVLSGLVRSVPHSVRKHAARRGFLRQCA